MGNTVFNQSFEVEGEDIKMGRGKEREKGKNRK